MVNKFIKCESYPERFWEDSKERLERRYSKAAHPDLLTVQVTLDGPVVTSTPGGYRIKEGGSMEKIPVFYSAGFFQGAFIIYNELVHFLPSEFEEAQNQFRALAAACERLNAITADEYELFTFKEMGRERE